jgi:hypothetical protein
MRDLGMCRLAIALVVSLDRIVLRLDGSTLTTSPAVVQFEFLRNPLTLVNF